MADDTKQTENVKAEVKEEKKEVKKVAGNVGKLVDEIAKLTVLELSELVSALQDKLGVSAVPIAQAQAAAPAGADPPAE